MLKTFRDFYAQKDYANAELVLQKHREEIPSGLWHYNLGTIKAQTQNWAEARFHFLRASNEGFSASENKQNLKFVEAKIEADRLEAPLSTGDYLVQGSMWAAGGALTTLSLFILVFGLLNLRKKRDYRLATLYAVLVALPLLLSWWISSWPRAIVAEPQMISEGPSAIFSSRNEIPAGVLVIAQDKGEWRKIIYPSRFSGWIKEQALKDLETE